MDAHRFYMGSGDGYKSTLGSIISLNRKTVKSAITSKSRKTEAVNPVKSRNNSFAKKVLFHLGMILIAINSLSIAIRAKKLGKSAYSYRQKGCVALMDRFPQEQFEGIYDGPKINYLAKKKLCSNIFTRILGKIEKGIISRCQKYQPDIVFKLVLSPEESLKRKPFENAESVKRKAELTPQISFQSSVEYTINAEQDYNLEILEIKRTLWNELIRRQQL